MSTTPKDPRRAQFDFAIAFANGGGLRGEGFRLDIEGEDISDAALADLLVRDLDLLMVDRVDIHNKTIIAEAHRRRRAASLPTTAAQRFVDLSHTIENGLITYKGLPAPLICDYLSREASRAQYAPGTEFHIGRIDMVANTGTYVDSPFHRYADGADIAHLALDRLAGLDGLVVDVTGARRRAIARGVLAPFDVRGKAVLVHTGWDAHWRSDRYFENPPFLTADSALYLRDAGARLVGIDAPNIDEMEDRARPVHTILLGAGIPIAEHLCRLGDLPTTGFRFSAVPPKVAGIGTFPVRAFAVCD